MQCIDRLVFYYKDVVEKVSAQRTQQFSDFSGLYENQDHRNTQEYRNIPEHQNSWNT